MKLTHSIVIDILPKATMRTWLANVTEKTLKQSDMMQRASLDDLAMDSVQLLVPNYVIGDMSTSDLIDKFDKLIWYEALNHWCPIQSLWPTFNKELIKDWFEFNFYLNVVDTIDAATRIDAEPILYYSSISVLPKIEFLKKKGFFTSNNEIGAEAEKILSQVPLNRIPRTVFIIPHQVQFHKIEDNLVRVLKDIVIYEHMLLDLTALADDSQLNYVEYFSENFEAYYHTTLVNTEWYGAKKLELA
jgi:hypothetical protein